MKCKISIAMCTYNGCKFLQEQLDSISSQTRLPDELIVCDDGSSDSTLSILKDFSDSAKFPVRIRCNSSRLGISKNFEQAISLARGNLIALCDQDDIWRHDKLEILVQQLCEKPEVGYVFTDAIVINELGETIHESLWKEVVFDRQQYAIFSRGPVGQLRVLFRGNKVTGATMAFRAMLKAISLPIPELWAHDAWIAFASSINGIRGLAIHEPLIYYRRHHGQAAGIEHPENLNLLRRAWNSFRGIPRAYESQSLELREWSKSLAFLENRSGPPPLLADLLVEKVNHTALRLRLYRLPRKTRLAAIANELIHGRYHFYSAGWKSAVKDLLFPPISALCADEPCYSCRNLQ